MLKPLVVSSEFESTAVLTPREWSLLREELNSDYKIRGDFLLHTAMRIREAQYVSGRPECYRKENAAIFLPRVAGMGKRKCIQKNRAVLLSPVGAKAVEVFFEMHLKLPSYQAMEPAFKRAAKLAGIEETNITTKMFRKTMISWLMVCFPDRQVQIAHSAGHNFETMLGHYLMYGFTREDVSEMKEIVKGWGEA
jgi:integrase